MQNKTTPLHFVSPSQGDVDAVMNAHPRWGNPELYNEFKTYLLDDPLDRQRAEGTIRSQKARWEEEGHTVVGEYTGGDDRWCQAGEEEGNPHQEHDQ